MDSLQIQSFNYLPPVFDITDDVVQVFTHKHTPERSATTFSSLIFEMEDGHLATDQKLLEASKPQYSNSVPNTEGVEFYRTGTLSALSMISHNVIGSDVVVQGDGESPMRFPQRLMRGTTFKDHLRARRCFYAQNFKKEVYPAKRVNAAYWAFQPKHQFLREDILNEEVDVFFYLPLGNTGNTFYMVFVDSDNNETSLKGNFDTDRFTFTSNWAVFIHRSELDEYGQYDRSVEFSLVNIVLDESEAVHLFCCRGTLYWPDCLTVECIECGVSTSGSQYCNNRMASCYALDDLWNLSEEQKNERMESIRRKNRAANKRLQKFHIGELTVSTKLLANQRFCTLFSADIVASAVDCFLCRLGTKLYKLTMSFDVLDDIYEYSLPHASTIVECSPFLDNQGALAFITNDGSFYVFCFEHIGALDLTPKVRNIVPKHCLSSVRLFLLSFEESALFVYFHDGRHHYMLKLQQSLLNLI